MLLLARRRVRGTQDGPSRRARRGAPPPPRPARSPPAARGSEPEGRRGRRARRAPRTKPPSGPTSTVHPSAARRIERNAPIRRRGRRRRAGRVDECVRVVDDVGDRREPGPAALHRGLARDRPQTPRPPRRPGLVPAHDGARGTHRNDARNAELRDAARRRFEPALRRVRPRARAGVAGSGSCRTSPRASSTTRPTPVSTISYGRHAPAPSAAVDVLADAQPSHSLQVMAVVAGDLARGRRARRRRRRARARVRRRRRRGAHDLNADRMRENKTVVRRRHLLAAQRRELREQLGFFAVSASARRRAPRPRGRRGDRRATRHAETRAGGATRRAGCPAGLRARAAVERVELDVRTERCLRDRDRELAPQVVAAPFEVGVRDDTDHDVEVAGRVRRAAPAGPRPASRSRCPSSMPAGTSTSIVRDPSTRPAPRHVVHGFGIDLAGAAHVDARRRGHDLAEQRPPHLANLAGALAGRTAIRVGAGRASGAVASVAADRHAQVERACGRRTRHRRASRSRTRLGVLAADGSDDGSRPPPKMSPPEKNASNRSFNPKEPAPPNGDPPAPVLPLVAEHVVRRRRSGSRSVSYARLISLNALGRGGIVGVGVGVVLARERAERPLDLVVGRRSAKRRAVS